MGLSRRKINPIYNESYQSMLKVFFISKMNKIELVKQAPKWNFSSLMVFLQFLPKFGQNFLYTQNE